MLRLNDDTPKSLFRAGEMIAKDDLTIDACHRLITALMLSILEQLCDVKVEGTSVKMDSHKLDKKSGTVTFQKSSLIESFRAMAALVYQRAFEDMMERIKRDTEEATTLDQLFEVVHALEQIAGYSMPVRLWEDACTASVSVADVLKKGHSIQVQLFKSVLLTIIPTFKSEMRRRRAQ